jgi:hypothetical protein
MNIAYLRSHYVFISALAVPFVAFAIYVAWTVVPLIVSEVVPSVVQSVTTSN